MQKATISSAGQEQQQSEKLQYSCPSATLPKSTTILKTPIQKEFKIPSSPHSLKSNLQSYLYQQPRFGPSPSHLFKQKFKQGYSSSQSPAGGAGIFAGSGIGSLSTSQNIYSPSQYINSFQQQQINYIQLSKNFGLVPQEPQNHISSSVRGKIPPTLTKVSLGEVSAKDSNILISGKSAVTGPVKPYHIKNNNTVIATTNLNSNMIKLRSKQQGGFKVDGQKNLKYKGNNCISLTKIQSDSKKDTLLQSKQNNNETIHCSIISIQKIPRKLSDCTMQRRKQASKSNSHLAVLPYTSSSKDLLPPKPTSSSTCTTAGQTNSKWASTKTSSFSNMSSPNSSSASRGFFSFDFTARPAPVSGSICSSLDLDDELIQTHSELRTSQDLSQQSGVESPIKILMQFAD